MTLNQRIVRGAVIALAVASMAACASKPKPNPGTGGGPGPVADGGRSEEHTSELQSH